MIPKEWRSGEVSVIGLGRTGVSVSKWLLRQGAKVYVSDSADSDKVKEAASALLSLGASVETGRHDVKRIENSVAVIVSPGVPPGIPPLVAARQAGVPIVAEIDLAQRVLRGSHLIVVTGTNGKTTVTAWLAHVLSSSGRRAVAAGNIGRPLIDVAGDDAPPDWVVIEASSYQLHDAPNLDPEIGVLTNLAPDHLDRYGTIEAYYADKKLLFQNADHQSVWVLNGDDEDVAKMTEGVEGKHLLWSMKEAADAWYDSATGLLILEGEAVVNREDLRLIGDHNISNALAVALAAKMAGLSLLEIETGLKTFAPLEHRLETVREVGGVIWINDSKATNVASSLVAFNAMTAPFVALMGGLAKGEDFGRLVPALGMCKEVVAFASSAEVISRSLSDAVRVTRVETMEQAIHHAHGVAASGDVVLLSPACASFDQFDNFEQRGRIFKQLVGELA
ncbi:MAG: UDP-N-acetylmuramoyl-L-alanine--D-glutamate ligase [Gemmatimonadota bacterium]|nr:UDP-N-acetylmuramoyl-L-alanine--D-glutamate ligase [Gemmatimonadota bacterium]